jgi:hypothetical protein
MKPLAYGPYLLSGLWSPLAMQTVVRTEAKEVQDIRPLFSTEPAEPFVPGLRL